MIDKNIPWSIHDLRHMIGGPNEQAEDSLGVWVRAVPCPYYAGIWGRLIAAWWVVTEQAFAVRWPQAGDLERALNFYKVPKKDRKNL